MSYIILNNTLTMYVQYAIIMRVGKTPTLIKKKGWVIMTLKIEQMEKLDIARKLDIELQDYMRACTGEPHLMLSCRLSVLPLAIALGMSYSEIDTELEKIYQIAQANQK